MTKDEFLTELRKRLSSLPPEDIEKSAAYYGEMIDDRMEDGMTEAEAVAALGTVDEILVEILANTPMPKLIRAKLAPRRALGTGEIILLVLGSPVWLPLLLALGVVLLAVYLVVWALVAVIYAVVFSFAAAAVASILGAPPLLFSGAPAQAALVAGSGLICAGLTILMFYAGNAAAKGAAVLGAKAWRGLKLGFARKETAQ